MEVGGNGDGPLSGRHLVETLPSMIRFFHFQSLPIRRRLGTALRLVYFRVQIAMLLIVMAMRMCMLMLVATLDNVLVAEEKV